MSFGAEVIEPRQNNHRRREYIFGPNSDLAYAFATMDYKSTVRLAKVVAAPRRPEGDLCSAPHPRVLRVPSQLDLRLSVCPTA